MPREDVGLLEGHVRGQPRRRADVEVRGEVVDRARTDGRGGVVDGPGHDRRGGRQPQRRGRGRGERAQHLGAGHDLGQLVGGDAAVAHQGVVVADAAGVAVVGHPRGEDRVVGGHEATGQAQVQVVEHVQELVGALVDLGEGVAHEQHVGRRVFAGRRGHAAGQADPAADARHAEARVVDDTAELAGERRRAAHVHPQDGVHERPPLGVDGHRALALRGTADGYDLAGGGRAAAQQPPGRRHKTVPPVVGALLGAAAGQHVQGDRLALPGDHAAVHGDQRRLHARRAQIDGKHVPAGTAPRTVAGPNHEAPPKSSRALPRPARSIAPGRDGARGRARRAGPGGGRAEAADSAAARGGPAAARRPRRRTARRGGAAGSGRTAAP